MLIGEFTVEPDSRGVQQVQQHELTIEYAPDHEWVGAQMQYQHDDGEWHYVVDTLEADESSPPRPGSARGRPRRLGEYSWWTSARTPL